MKLVTSCFYLSIYKVRTTLLLFQGFLCLEVKENLFGLVSTCKVTEKGKGERERDKGRNPDLMDKNVRTESETLSNYFPKIFSHFPKTSSNDS